MANELKSIESVTKQLRSDFKTMSEFHDLNDAVIVSYSETECMLSPSESTVHKPQFKFAVLKVQLGYIQSLSCENCAVVRIYEFNDGEDSTHEGNSVARVSYAQRALMKLIGSVHQTRAYVDLGFFLPTSNICE